MPNQEQWDKSFLMHACVASMSSKDPSTKVGAVIVSKDNRQLSCGYNGFPRGTDDCSELWNNREEKYPRVIHAEVNSILNCPFDTTNCTLYCTHEPCHSCLGFLIQAKIRRIVYMFKWDRATRKHISEEYSLHFEEILQLAPDDVTDMLAWLNDVID